MKLGPLPPVGDLSMKEALEAIRHDKKIVNGTLHYVLCTGIGSWTTVTDVSEDELAKALKRSGSRSKTCHGRWQMADGRGMLDHG